MCPGEGPGIPSAMPEELLWLDMFDDNSVEKQRVRVGLARLPGPHVPRKQAEVHE